MTGDDFKRISQLRTEDALVLLQQKRYAAAYYIVGYAVECAFKVVICRRVKPNEFPAKNFSHQVYTHELTNLRRLAGLEDDMENEFTSNPKLNANWNLVKTWDEESRYSESFDEPQAKEMFEAVTDLEHGVLACISKFY